MPRDAFASARVINIVVGVWLFISAFIWPHSQAQMTNTWIVGVLAVAFAVAAMRAEQARYLNTILAVWLFISVWTLPSLTLGTMWNNALAAILMFFASLVPNFVGERARTTPRL